MIKNVAVGCCLRGRRAHRQWRKGVADRGVDAWEMSWLGSAVGTTWVEKPRVRIYMENGRRLLPRYIARVRKGNARRLLDPVSQFTDTGSRSRVVLPRTFGEDTNSRWR